jgi:hypothetical protein
MVSGGSGVSDALSRRFLLGLASIPSIGFRHSVDKAPRTPRSTP